MAFLWASPFCIDKPEATKTVAFDQKQLKQLLDCVVLGRGFKMLLTFHVKRFAAHVSVSHETKDKALQQVLNR